jgi:hypothetical protein
MLYTKEGRKVHDSPVGCVSSRQALERVQSIRQSVACAKPYSAALLAYGEVFAYSEGVLSYVDGQLVRVVDIHGASKVEEVIDVSAISQNLACVSTLDPALLLSSNDTQIINLSYSEGVLVCVCESEISQESWLLVIDLGTSFSTTIKRRRYFKHPLNCSTKLFIRHNRSYLYYGTHSALRSDGHHEWLMTGLDLENGGLITHKPFQLADFVGSDIGSTACFEIHDDFLFAVSNQTSFEVEEVDWTSYYHCVKILLGDPKPDLEAHRIWQRQHGEGPINDSWTDLSLQKDGQTDELLIVECRKEWLGGGSANIRTYYTQPLRFNTDDEEVMQMCNFPVNDPLTKTLDENSKPHFSEPRKRIRKHYHHEYEQNRLDPHYTAPKDFILAKTKFRAYNLSAMSFLDLVSDPAPIPGSLRTRDRMRLRIASRRQKSPLERDPDNPGHMLLRRTELDEKGDPLEGSEHDFHPTEVHLWPPDDAPTKIYDVLYPGGRLEIIEAIADDRSIIYMTNSPNPANGRGRAVVMINFDPAWGHNYRSLAMPSSHPVMPVKEMKLELPSVVSSRNTSKRASPLPERGSSASPSQQPKRQKCEPGPAQAKTPRPWLWKEDAMHLSIDHGYRLR